MRWFRLLWNVGLFALRVDVLWQMGPKVFRQVGVAFEYKHIETTQTALEGVGLLVGILLLFATLGSWTWQRIKLKWRIGAIAVAAILILGCFAGIYQNTQEAAGGLIFYGDLVTFALFVAAVAFPIVAFGLGYPGLMIKGWQKIRSREHDKRAHAGEDQVRDQMDTTSSPRSEHDWM